MKKVLVFVQIISTFSLLLSKYFLAIDEVLGWWLAVLGYACVAFYNSKVNLKIYVWIGISLTFLTAYGGYKWSQDLMGLGIFDYLVVLVTIIATVYIGFESYKSKKENPLWKPQVMGTILFMAAFLLLGWGYIEGWYVIILGHMINTYVYGKKKAYWYAGLQPISIYIAIAKLAGWPIIFF